MLEFDQNQRPAVLSEVIASQSHIHREYGGVVPELAAREHLSSLPLLSAKVLADTGTRMRDLSAIAVTRGPGLKGCLLMGFGFAQGLALSADLPLVGVNHIEGHALSPLLDNPDLDFPYLCLIVSGGHTEIQAVHGLGRYQLIARTGDDAAGEAFDKSANLLSFEYPGGASLAALADTVNHSEFKLPKVMREAEGFSFSGLKTAISLLVKKEAVRIQDPQVRAELAFAVQESIVDALVFKLKAALSAGDYRRVAVCGGVAANQALRKRIQGLKGVDVYFPKLTHCMDNAAMIGMAGALRFLRSERLEAGGTVMPRWPLETLQ